MNRDNFYSYDNQRNFLEEELNKIENLTEEEVSEICKQEVNRLNNGELPSDRSQISFIRTELRK